MSKKQLSEYLTAVRVTLAESPSSEQRLGVERTVRNLCYIFLAADKTFDRAFFLAACGVPEKEV